MCQKVIVSTFFISLSLSFGHGTDLGIDWVQSKEMMRLRKLLLMMDGSKLVVSFLLSPLFYFSFC